MPLSTTNATTGGTLVGEELAKVTPRRGESKQDFVSRCISAMSDEGVDDNDQRVAMCHSMWEQAMKKRDTVLKAAEFVLDEYYREDDEATDEIDARVQVFKVDDDGDTMFIEGCALAPESTDRQGDIISKEEIRRAAYKYMAESQMAGVMHKRILPSNDAVLVESRILKRNEKLGGNQLKEGSWVVKFHIVDEDLKGDIRNGRLNGFSIGGISEAVEEDD